MNLNALVIPLNAPILRRASRPIFAAVAVLATALPAAAPAQEGPYLISLQQRELRRADGSSVGNYPGYVAANRAYIDTLPFDGVAIHTPTGRTLMGGPLIGYNTIYNDWAPLSGVTWQRMKHNFAIVNVDRPADFFDDWTATIENYRTLARVLREIGIQGILFDNEDYQRSLWFYPRDVSYPGRSVQEYHDQARLRGRQVMEAVVSAYPDIDMMVLISPSFSFGRTPRQVDYWAGDNRLGGAFTVGLFEGRGSQATVIDGGEAAYGYRSEDDFQVSYDWRKYGIASPQANCPFIPPATRPSWPEMSISFGLYNGIFPRELGLTMNPAIMRQIVERALVRCDKYVWLYWETNGGNWYVPGSVSGAYVAAVVDGKAAAGSAPPPPDTPPPPPPPPPPSTLLTIDAVWTGKDLALGVAQVGAQYYVDRSYTITSLDGALAGGVLVRTANDDSEFDGSPYLILTTSKTATVYVCYDNRGTTLPGWLRDGTWTATSLTFAGSDAAAAPMRVYSKVVPAGQFTLGGNLDDGAGAGSMYAVVVKEGGAGPNSPPTVEINSPAEGAVFSSRASATVIASASDDDGSVVQVTFFEGATEIGSDSDGEDGWSAEWTGEAGTYLLTAMVTDDQGATALSAPIGVTVLPED
ncbi:MAG: Ig-like domain-containing protein, partial [Verrucomicrobiota bacterium]|nr:Ig-like domain-containing protein [Verrucomicrobiota bacterium]